MGRKAKSKQQSKEKKLAKKQERLAEDAQIAGKQQLCDTANAFEDPMRDLAPFKKFDRNGLKADISCHRVTNLDKDTVDWIFNLTKENMETLYNDTDLGWVDKDKRQELTEDAAWHMLAKEPETGKLLAFVHFRFDMDEGDAVLYCYEIQLIKGVQRKGLGKFLMQILELMAHKHNMEKVMMTVFKANHAGQDFFKKTMKYAVDETSPEESLVEALYDEDSYTYQILSKIMPGKKKPLSQNGSNTANAAAAVKS